jgi:hypothetical protein
LDLFFDARTTSTGQSDLIDGSISQFVVEFVAAPPNRFRMEAGDLGDPLKTTMPQALGLSPRNPTTLLLVQPAQEQIELPMIFASRMFTSLAVRATTLVNHQFRGHCPTPSLECGTIYNESSISRNRSWTGS